MLCTKPCYVVSMIRYNKSFNTRQVILLNHDPDTLKPHFIVMRPSAPSEVLKTTLYPKLNCKTPGQKNKAILHQKQAASVKLSQ